MGRLLEHGAHADMVPTFDCERCNNHGFYFERLNHKHGRPTLISCSHCCRIACDRDAVAYILKHTPTIPVPPLERTRL